MSLNLNCNFYLHIQQEAFKKLAKEITDNIPTKYYKIYYKNEA